MRILVLINDPGGLFKFRRELLQELIRLGHEVYFSAPAGEYVSSLTGDGCVFVETPIDRRGTNVVRDASLFLRYMRMMHDIRPDMVLTYTIKPNLYGALACRLLRLKNINTVTGLGSVYIHDLPIRRVIVKLTKLAFKRSEATVFMNRDNEAFYRSLGILTPSQRTVVVHGSGVNLDSFAYSKWEDKPTSFLFVGRIFKDKGIAEYIEAARSIKAEFPECCFHVVGPYNDEAYRPLIDTAVQEGIVEYHGMQGDVQPFMRGASCLVLPSYGEGCGTVLQEAAALGRPLIACDTYGCRDNVDEGYNGYLCKVADAGALTECMKRFIGLSYEEKAEMGRNSRRKAESEFDREKVVGSYIDLILNTTKKADAL